MLNYALATKNKVKNTVYDVYEDSETKSIKST
ncbi:hypothetical protein, partial [Paenibacillus larvae]